MRSYNQEQSFNPFFPLRKLTSFSLSEEDQLRCSSHSLERDTNNKQHKVKDKPHFTNPPSYETTLNGVGGEMAFARLLNAEPDFSIGIRSKYNKTDTSDIIFKDLNIEIKTSWLPHGRLLIDEWVPATTDVYYVLMIGTFPHYVYKGFCISDFLFSKPLEYVGKRKVRIVSQKELLG